MHTQGYTCHLLLLFQPFSVLIKDVPFAPQHDYTVTPRAALRGCQQSLWEAHFLFTRLAKCRLNGSLLRTISCRDLEGTGLHTCRRNWKVMICISLIQLHAFE